MTLQRRIKRCAAAHYLKIEVIAMSDPQYEQFGDGQDDYLRGAQKAAEAVQKFGEASAQTAASDAAAATIQAGTEGGAAAAGIAANVMAGPWGATLSAAWSLRHTLLKILVAFCLFLLFVAMAIVSLPSIVTNNLFHTDPSTVDLSGPTSILGSYDDMAATVSGCVQGGYDNALARVNAIIAEGGYDQELSMQALINNALVSVDYDTCYILSAYSAAMGQRGTSKADLKSKLDAVADQMFAVTYEVKEATKTVQPEAAEGEEPGEPEEITVQYVVCTVHPFDQSVILTAFGLDPSAQYDQFNITYGEAIDHMASALKMTMYGSHGNGSVPPITDTELTAYVNGLTCSEKRKDLMRAALSLVGKVPYFWGGKSAPGWNDAWNTPRLVTAAGSSTSGTMQPYGLDCSGFTSWAYMTAFGVNLGNGWDTTYAITEAELLPGDIGMMAARGTVAVNHILIYAGKNADGKKMWVHCTYGSGVVLNTPTYVTQFRRPSVVDLDAAPAQAA